MRIINFRFRTLCRRKRKEKKTIVHYQPGPFGGTCTTVCDPLGRLKPNQKLWARIKVEEAEEFSSSAARIPTNYLMLTENYSFASPRRRRRPADRSQTNVQRKRWTKVLQLKLCSLSRRTHNGIFAGKCRQYIYLIAVINYSKCMATENR